MTTTSAPKSNKSPLEILELVSAKAGDKLWSNAGDKDRDIERAGQRGRIFTDVAKEITNPMVITESQFKSISELAKSLELPLQQGYIDKIVEKLKGFYKDLTEDPKWEPFWKDIAEKYQLDPSEIALRQQNVLNAYGMKCFAIAQKRLEVEAINAVAKADSTLHNLKKENKDNKEIEAAEKILLEAEKKKGKVILFKDLTLKTNIANRDKNENQTHLEYIKNELQRETCVNLVKKFPINGVIKSSIEKLKKDPPPNDEKIEQLKDEIQNGLKEEWKKIIDTPLGDSNRDNFIQFFGNDGGKKLFDEYFNFEAIKPKIQNYFKLTETLGFDINDKQKSIDNFSGITRLKHSGDDKKVFDNYKFQLEAMVYYPLQDVKVNEDLLKNTSLEVFRKHEEKLTEVLNKNAATLAQEGNLERIKEYARIGITTDETKEILIKNAVTLAKEGNIEDIYAKIGITKDETRKILNTNADTAAKEGNLEEMNEYAKIGITTDETRKILNTNADTATKEGNLEKIKEYAKMGFVSKETTTNYKRDFLQVVKDGFKDFPKNIGHFINNPPLSAIQLAKMMGDTELVETINQAQTKQSETSWVGIMKSVLKQDDTDNDLLNLTTLNRSFTAQLSNHRQAAPKLHEKPPQPNIPNMDISNCIKMIEARIDVLNNDKAEYRKNLIKAEKESLTAIKDVLNEHKSISPGSEECKTFTTKLDEKLSAAHKAMENANAIYNPKGEYEHIIDKLYDISVSVNPPEKPHKNKL